MPSLSPSPSSSASWRILRPLLAVFVSSLCLATLGHAQATNLIYNGNAEHGPRGWLNIVNTEPAIEIGATAFVIEPGRAAISQAYIEIDPTKNYRLSGSFRAQRDDATALYFGFQCFDENKNHIESTAVTIEPNTETKLAAPASPGDQIIRIADGSRWRLETPLIRRNGIVAFDIDPSGHLTDLPNRNLSPMGLSGARTRDGTWEIRLNGPLTTGYPVGTPIRLHRQGWGHAWPARMRAVRLTTSWQELHTELSGIAPHAGDSTGFWPGTRFVRIIIQGDCLAANFVLVELP